MSLHIEGHHCMKKGIQKKNTSLQQTNPLKPFPVELLVKNYPWTGTWLISYPIQYLHPASWKKCGSKYPGYFLSG
jgi:hypothetical protein